MHRHLPGALAALSIALWPAAAAAELRASVGSWRYDLAGTVDDRGRVYDFERDLELQAGGRRTLLVELDTGRGWWPDFTASISQLAAAGDHEETFTAFNLLGQPVGEDTRTIVASADFDDFDVAAQYPWQLGPARVSLGLVVKRLSGSMRIEDTRESEPVVEDYDETIPEARVQLRWPVASWLALVGAFQGVSYGGDSATEWRAAAEARWRALLLEAGWQAKAYDFAIEGYAFDAQLDGLLVRAGFVWR